MATNRVATGSLISLCLILVWSIPPSIAQPPEADELRTQLEAILDNDELSRLEQVSQLRKLVEREEATLIQNEVTRWIEELSDAEFNSRELAQKNLIEAGEAAIAAVARAARRDDRERAERCLSIVTAIAKGNDGAAAASALAALQRLSAIESPIGARAAKTLAELNETDEDRALAALARIEARVHKDDQGDVTYVSAIRGVSDRELKLLAAFPRMRMLTVGGEGITDEGLEGLVELKSLRHLSLLRTSVTDAGLAKLATLPRLEMLTLGGARITSEGLRKLKDSRSLQTLGLFEFRPTAADIEVLSDLNIRGLSFSLKGVKDEDLKALEGLTKLTYLTLSDSPDLTDAGVAYLSNLSLRSLHLPSGKITDDGLRHLSQMTSLTSLFLGGEQITDAGMEHLTGLKALTSIALSNTRVSDEGAGKLQAALPGLRNIHR